MKKLVLVCLLCLFPLFVGAKTLNNSLIDDPITSLVATDTVKSEGIFAEIHVHDGSTAQSIATGAGYVKLTGFAHDGDSANCTPDVANDKITITKAGKYFVVGSFSFTSGSVNTTFFCAPFLNGVEQDQIHWNRKVATTGDVGAAPFSGIIDVTTAPWDLDVRIRHNQGGSVDFTPVYMNLTVFYLGDT